MTQMAIGREGKQLTTGKVWQQLAIATNWPVLVAVGVLSSLGVISIWANARAAAQKQLVFLGISVGCMTLFQAADYRKIGRLAWGFYAFSFLLILYTVVGARMSLPFVHAVNGANAWITFGRVSLEPAELMKIAFILVLARYLRFRSNYRTVTGLIAPFALAVAPVVLILKQPDLGMAMLFLPILIAMLFVAGARIGHLLKLFGCGLVLAPLAWFSGMPTVPVLRHLPPLIKTYQRERVEAFLDSDNPAEQRKRNFQVHQALTAMGSGGLGGKGFQVIPVGQTVPEAHNDMVFALIGEQFGLLGSAAVLGSFIVLFAAGIEIAAATREPFGRLIAVGIVAALAAQSFINLMVCTGLMPVTGITLPFVSYGGSSLVASFMAVGLLLNVGQNRPLVMARESFEF